MEAIDPFVFRLSIFVLAIFVGYFVVWSVTPALHTPLMAVTNAISSVIVVGALIAVAVPTPKHPPSVLTYQIASEKSYSFSLKEQQFDAWASHIQKVSLSRAPLHNPNVGWYSKLLGFFALILASVNIFGGFLVTQRMLAMYKKKGGK